MNFPSDRTKQTLAAIGESIAFPVVYYLSMVLVWDSLTSGVIYGKRGFSCSWADQSLCYFLSVAGVAAMGSLFALGAWVAIHDIFNVRLLSKLDQSGIVSFFRSRRTKMLNWLVMPASITVLAALRIYEFFSTLYPTT